jgi:CheY-like chemotaxis protein
VLREGLIALLRQLGPDTVVLEAGDAETALRLVEEQRDLDVVILDLVMPGMNASLPNYRSCRAAMASGERSRPPAGGLRTVLRRAVNLRCCGFDPFLVAAGRAGGLF